MNEIMTRQGHEEETVKEVLDKDDRIKKVIFNVFKNEDMKIYDGLLS